MEKLRPERTEDQYVTYPIGEALGGNVHVRSSKRIRKFPQRYNPGFGAARECKNYDVASIFYKIQYGDINSNVNTGGILLLLDERDAEDCMDAPSTFHMR